MASDLFEDIIKLLKWDYIIACLSLSPSVRKPRTNLRFDGLLM